MGLIELIVLIVILVIVLVIMHKYVVPNLPSPWGNIAMAVAALIIIIYLLSRIGVIPALD